MRLADMKAEADWNPLLPQEAASKDAGRQPDAPAAADDEDEDEAEFQSAGNEAEQIFAGIGLSGAEDGGALDWRRNAAAVWNPPVSDDEEE